MSPRATTPKPSKPPRPPRAPRPPKAPKPWSRAEAGRYASADGRFMLESDGAGRWFATDAGSLDELGLARTTGPYPTLDAAKAAADAAREAPAIASPLAARLAAARGRGADAEAADPSVLAVAPAPAPASRPALPPHTWLDDLRDTDADRARRARRLVTTLEREGIADADTLVRRDLLGDQPAIATRLLARDVLAALAALHDPDPVAVAEAVAAVLAASGRRPGLPGWELREHDGPSGRDRPIRLTAAELLAAAATAPSLEGDAETESRSG